MNKRAGRLDSFDSMGRVTGPTVAGLLFALRDDLPFATGAADDIRKTQHGGRSPMTQPKVTIYTSPT